MNYKTTKTVNRNRKINGTITARQKHVYEKMGKAIFHNAISGILDKLPYDDMTRENYPSMVRMSIGMAELKIPMQTLYMRVGILQAEQTQKEIDQIFKSKKLALFNRSLASWLANYIREYMGEKIISMSRTLALKVINAIADMIADDKPDSIRDISRKIKKKVLNDKFYQWEIERIARTETTNAANMASWRQAETSPIVLEKVWVATYDERVRTKGWDHLEKEHTTADFYEYFEFINKKTGEKDYLMWPGQDGGEAGNVINCRCTIGYVGKRDANGRLIPNTGSPRGLPPRPKPTKPQKPVKPKPEIPEEFKPAWTRREAELRLNKLGIKIVNLKGLKVNQWNAVLHAMEDEAKFAPLNLRMIKTSQSHKNRAYAWYSYGHYVQTGEVAYNDIYINIPRMKDAIPRMTKSYQNRIDDLREKLISNGWLQPDAEIPGDGWRGLSPSSQLLRNRALEKITEWEKKIAKGERARPWGINDTRPTAYECIKNIIHHEVGHNRHRMQFPNGYDNTDFTWKPEWAPSDYGAKKIEEYVAEWYAYYWANGEKGIPKDLLKMFLDLKKL